MGNIAGRSIDPRIWTLNTRQRWRYSGPPARPAPPHTPLRPPAAAAALPEPQEATTEARQDAKGHACDSTDPNREDIAGSRTNEVGVETVGVRG